MSDAVDRCEALLPRLFAEIDAEKKVKDLRKKFRDIQKLKEKKAAEGPLDKLQEQKIEKEAELLTKLSELEEAFPEKKESSSEEESSEEEPMSNRAKAKAKAAGKAKFKPAPRKADKDAPAAEKQAAAEEDLDGAEKEKRGALESSSLKTKRQQQAASAAPVRGEAIVEMDASAATWPEVQDVAASGSGGVDKGRQKHALIVNQAKGVGPYGQFDRYIWQCNFLTRLELKLPPGVLDGDAFQQGFPGSLTSLLELILKENALTSLPPKLNLCTRLRSLDVSHNKLEELPPSEVWTTFAGCLENLDLGFNKLTTVASIQPLCKLSTLKLDGNKLTSLDGINWPELKQITSLTAVGNEIVEVPEEIGAVGDSMMHLDFSANQIVALPQEMTELKKLKELAAADNPIKDQKVVKYLEKGGRGLKELFVYLEKNGGARQGRGGKKR